MSEVKLKQNDLSRLVLIRAVIIACPTVPLGAGTLAGPHVGPDACAIAEGRIFAAASSATCRFTNPVRAKGLEPGAEDLALFAEVVRFPDGTWDELEGLPQPLRNAAHGWIFHLLENPVPALADPSRDRRPPGP
jgi:hypothetical protein